jgi:hypothetical protein
VPLTAETSAVLREYPYAPGSPNHNPSAPLFPAIRLTGSRAEVPVTNEHLDWLNPLRHTTFYARVFAPALPGHGRLTRVTHRLPALRSTRSGTRT